MTQAARILAFLAVVQIGTTAEIAAGIRAPAPSVRRVLAWLLAEREVVRYDGPPVRWALADVPEEHPDEDEEEDEENEEDEEGEEDEEEDEPLKPISDLQGPPLEVRLGEPEDTYHAFIRLWLRCNLASKYLPDVWATNEQGDSARVPATAMADSDAFSRWAFGKGFDWLSLRAKGVFR